MKILRSTSRPVAVALSLISLVGVGVVMTGTASAASTSCAGLSSSSTSYNLLDQGESYGKGKLIITKKVGTSNTYLVRTRDTLSNTGRHKMSVTVKHTRANGSSYGSTTDSGMFLDYAGCLTITVKNGEYMTASGALTADGVKYTRTQAKVKYNSPSKSDVVAKAKAAKTAKAKKAAAAKKAKAKKAAAAKKKENDARVKAYLKGQKEAAAAKKRAADKQNEALQAKLSHLIKN